MGFLEGIEKVNSAVNNFMWGPIMLVLMVGTGIYLSARTGFFQVTRIGTWFRETLGSLGKKKSKTKDKGAVSPFAALSTALASTIGVGNIAGVATAIVSGGPGAIFWMWVSALFGMMTKYSEIVLAMHFRKRNKKGEWVGGPMYYIEKGLHCKWLAVLFAIFALIASFGIGNMSQSNTIAGALQSSFGLPPWVSGVGVALIVAAVILGGLNRISKVTSFIVPFMGFFYLLGGLIIIFTNWQHIGPALASIFEGAFSMKAVGGGVLGYAMFSAMRFGVARGVFSNEAGLGSAPIVHAAADNDHPAKQGMWGIFEVFADTILVCTITALVILVSGKLGTVGLDGKVLDGAALSSAAFESGFPGFGQYFVSISIFFFAVSTLLGWSYYGEKSLEYLCREGKSGKYSVIYKIVFLGAIVLGATMNLKLVWDISDTFNAMMALPNLIAVIGLSGIVFKITRDYRKNYRKPRLHSTK